MHRREVDLPLGWRTELAVLRRTGSTVEERTDHLVVRSPENPFFHWGHFVLVTDPGAGQDAESWIARFTEAFPDEHHRAIGLAADVDGAPWTDQGLAVVRSPVLTSTEPLRDVALADGYRVAELESSADWTASSELRAQSYPGDPEFAAWTTQTRRAALGEDIAWFGAFAPSGELAAELGIVDCGGGTARYQGVLTHPEHRRRGLVGHLLGVADEHVRVLHATTRTVIIGDEGSPAIGLYRSVGFVETTPKVGAYRYG